MFGSKIDYFVVSDAFVQSGSNASTLEGYTYNPHVPIKLELCKDPRKASESVLTVPKRFPAEWPIGCSGEPRRFDSDLELDKLEGYCKNFYRAVEFEWLATYATHGPFARADRFIVNDARIEFEKNATFQGARDGFAYKTGMQGTGYYRDVFSNASEQADGTQAMGLWSE